MNVFQVLSGAAALASFAAHIVIARSVTEDVNDRLGTDYKGIWSPDGSKTWAEHERLFPSSRKRVALAATFLVAASTSMRPDSSIFESRLLTLFTRRYSS